MSQCLGRLVLILGAFLWCLPAHAGALEKPKVAIAVGGKNQRPARADHVDRDTLGAPARVAFYAIADGKRRLAGANDDGVGQDLPCPLAQFKMLDTGAVPLAPAHDLEFLGSHRSPSFAATS